MYYATREALGLSFVWSAPVAFLARFMTVYAAVIAVTKDLPDVAGDIKGGIDTFASRLGVRKVANGASAALALNYAAAVATACLAPAGAFRRWLMAGGHLLAAGWLFKEGGRKTGIALAGWKKRWFVLVPPGKEGGAAQLRYFESPQSKKPKGAIVLKGSDVFVPKKMRGPSGSSYQHCFCVTSTGVQEGQDAGSRQPTTTCTLLAASSDDDRQKWIHATRALMMASDAHKGHVKSGSVRRA